MSIAALTAEKEAEEPRKNAEIQAKNTDWLHV
jgi:hypothetical protein